MNRLGSCFAAFRFLTVFPLPSSLGRKEEDLAGAVYFFPVVGLVLGAMAVAGALLIRHLFPPFPAAVLLVGLILSFSGALHLDGLADTADGFFSARDRDTILEIMRDSRIGVMGAASLFLLLTLKVACLTVMDHGLVLKASLLTPLAGRCALLLAMGVLPYARPDGGLGTLFYSSPLRRRAAVGGTVILFVVSTAVLGFRGLAAASVIGAATLLFCLFCHRKIGGATGDTLGASCEAAETVLLVFLAAGMSE
ncbi:MAG TPA: adenosylcobinamide-GDP ribazoletransferase [Desulfobacteraceae bacterium]|nr:adenosylcobinamide-GDP ribazoletransferase [Desulfobacteraceae bacterium]